uniref:Putative secreted protein n=1 Tax=Ixodes ricinus TaxID=34613 RepID=A0A6B0UFY8_IXORI
MVLHVSEVSLLITCIKYTRCFFVFFFLVEKCDNFFSWLGEATKLSPSTCKHVCPALDYHAMHLFNARKLLHLLRFACYHSTLGATEE